MDTKTTTQALIVAHVEGVCKMPRDGNKELVIDQSGIHYRERGTLGWMHKDFDWSDVNRVEVDDINDVNANDDSHPIELSGHLILSRADEVEEGSTGKPTVFDSIFAQTGIAVDPESGRVSFDPEESDAQNFAKFFEFLIDEGFINESELPFRTDRQENYILNTEPRHPDKDMRRGVEVGDGIWLETSVPINQKKHHILEAVRRYIPVG